jgi:hypothetical protein
VRSLFEARATTADELREIDYVGDAYFDPDEAYFDEDSGVFVIPFSQQPPPDLEGAPEIELVKPGGHGRIERVPYLRHELRFAHVEKWGLSRRGRDEPGMFYGLEWKPAAREVRATTSTGPSFSVIVRALDVTLAITDHIDGWVRRKHSHIGETDAWEQDCK